jgi:hypothetical protein
MSCELKFVKNALLYMQEVCEALKKTLPHILDEIEGLNIFVAALRQQIQSIVTTPA